MCVLGYWARAPYLAPLFGGGAGSSVRWVLRVSPIGLLGWVWHKVNRRVLSSQTYRHLKGSIVAFSKEWATLKGEKNGCVVAQYVLKGLL